MIIYALKCGFHVTLHSFSAKLKFPFNNFYKYTMLQEFSTEQLKTYMYSKRCVCVWGGGGCRLLGVFQYATSMHLFHNYKITFV